MKAYYHIMSIICIRVCYIMRTQLQDFFPLPLFETEDGLVYVDNRYNIIEIEEGTSFNMSCIGSYLQYYNVGYKDLESVVSNYFSHFF